MGILKGFIYIFILILSSYVGLAISSKYKKRVIALKDFCILLNIMITKIKYSSENLSEIFTEFSKYEKSLNSKLFKNLSENLSKNGVQNAWNYAVDEYGIYFSLDDKNIIKTLGKNLGKTDFEGQISAINEVIELIKMQVDLAENERSKNEKMYKTLGVVIGLAIIIVLV